MLHRTAVTHMRTESAPTPEAALLDEHALMRLLQLASPGLPIGAYAFSQGLEWAVEAGWVTDERTLEAWTRESLVNCVARVDVPVLARLYAAARRDDEARLAEWSAYLVACRE